MPRGPDAPRPVELEQALGASWYERWLAWSHWQLYLILGKIETAAWILRKPPTSS